MIGGTAKGYYSDLTEEQKAKVKNAKSPEDIMDLAKEEGYELTDEQLEGISGGAKVCWYVPDCTEHKEHW